jgi:hypothetical protein
MQLKILFILSLTRHVSAEVGHHQVFFTKIVSLQFVYLVLLMYTLIYLFDVLSRFFQHIQIAMKQF